MRDRLRTLAILALMLLPLALHAINRPSTHNAAGGYIGACGDLPGLVGDDC